MLGKRMVFTLILMFAIRFFVFFILNLQKKNQSRQKLRTPFEAVSIHSEATFSKTAIYFKMQSIVKMINAKNI